jgi:aryl-alcohol dehydrogenase-like predicted oxidoreductase/enamine deaminase RidA (YjgF/YER057c/UK114 family)
MSRVVTGLWQVADLERNGRKLDIERTASAMEPYVAAGFTTFDMADHYGSAEIVAGTFRKHHPEGPHVQLLTKWVPPPGRVSREDARAAVHRALDRLHVTSIDLLQFHTWSYADPAWLDALFFLQEMKEEGLVRNLGVTNFDTPHLRVAMASKIPIVSNQVSYSLVDRRAEGRMTAFCLDHGIKILAYGTIAGGWLSDRWLDREEPDWERTGTWSQMKYGRFVHTAGGWALLQRLLRTLASIAARHQVSIANVASRYILEQPAVGGVIIGARLGEKEHIADNARLFGFTLTDEDRKTLEATLADFRPIPGDTGDEYRKPPFLTASGDLSHHLTGMPSPYEVKTGKDGRLLCLSGTSWESMAGYARAVRRGSQIHVSGTTAAHGGRLIGGQDPAAQTHFVIDKIEGALQSLGARLEDVVRTRIFVSKIDQWEPVARAHGERFGLIQPVNTLVRAELVGEEYLVEMEAYAELSV